MIGNPKWFKRRKYMGWGITPVTWQGWLYLLGLLSLILLVYAVMRWFHIKLEYSITVMTFLLGLMLIDTSIIMHRLDKDEREAQHEAIAERNAAWAMLIIIGAGIIFQVVSGIVNQNIILDPFLIGALLIGVLAKSLTNWYLIDK